MLVQFQSHLLLLLIMSKLIAVLACLAVVVAVASAEPRYAKLQNKLSCGLDQVIMCEGEIESKDPQC